MKFSVNWLRQWVPVEQSAQDLAEALTAAGLEVVGPPPEAAHVVALEVARGPRDAAEVRPPRTGAEGGR